MAGSETITKDTAKVAEIAVPPELIKNNVIFLFLNTFCAGMLMSLPGLLQPAFLKDSINSNWNFAGSINSLLMNFSLEVLGDL